MGAKVEQDAQVQRASDGKAPRTARGERTLRKILDAARDEFGERGFSDSSIVGITQRAGVALGTFYTYFDSKEALFQALVRDMSAQVRDHVAPGVHRTRRTRSTASAARSSAFLRFAREHRDIYRIIDESEFVEPSVYREHYETTASRIAARLVAARDKGEIGADFADEELEMLAWAMMGANVFLGIALRRVGRCRPGAHRRGHQPHVARGVRTMSGRRHVGCALSRIAISSFATGSSCTSATIRAAAKPPLLCLHGLTRNARDFADFAERYSSALSRHRA